MTTNKHDLQCCCLKNGNRKYWVGNISFSGCFVELLSDKHCWLDILSSILFNVYSILHPSFPSIISHALYRIYDITRYYKVILHCNIITYNKKSKNRANLNLSYTEKKVFVTISAKIIM